MNNVKAGIYTVNVQDGNLCSMSAQVPITSTDGAQSTWLATSAKCFDSFDGSASITITQGEGPFNILWPDGQNTLEGFNLKGGSYNVLITDVHNCTVVQTVDVPAPDPLQFQFVVKAPTCNGYCDGQLTLQALGGTGNYTYSWNGGNASTQSALCAGTYPVHITDNNHCILDQDVVLTQPDPITVRTRSYTLATCRDACDGMLEVEAKGGNGAYQYKWATGETVATKNKVCPGNYAISIVDNLGCTGTGVMVLDNTAPLPLDLGGGVTLCVGQTYALDAGPNWKLIQWWSNTSFSSTQQNIVIKDAGSYYLEVYNAKGCVAQDTFLLQTSYDLLKASFMIPEQAMAGDTVAIIDISWPLPDAIEWDYPAEMKKVLDLGDVLFGQFSADGTYDVNLKTHLGECYDEITKTITILKDTSADAGGRLGYENFVKEFTLHPNPNNGLFNISIRLLENSPITLSAWNNTTGVMLNKVQQRGANTYELSFDLRPISAGAYMLRLDHEKGKMYLRFIIE